MARHLQVGVASHQQPASAGCTACVCVCMCARVSAHVRPCSAESAWGGRCCEQSSRRLEVRAPGGGAASCLQCCSPGALQWAGETGRAAFPISPFPSSVVGYVAFHALGHSPLSEPGPAGRPFAWLAVATVRADGLTRDCRNQAERRASWLFGASGRYPVCVRETEAQEYW